LDELPRDEHGRMTPKARGWLIGVSLCYSIFWMGLVLLLVPFMDLSGSRKRFRATYMQKTA